MKIRIIVGVISYFFTFSYAYSQLIIEQNWETSTTVSDNGVTANSISPSAFIANGGSSGKGLNAGLPKRDIDLTYSGSLFDVDGIDVSLDFQRDEGTGNFFRRGQSFKFGMSSGKLRVSFRLEDGFGSYYDVYQNNIMYIPNDNIFRNYRFVYDPNTGIAQVLVDDDVKWEYEGYPGVKMYWNGAGNFRIGAGLDGTGYNRVIIDKVKVSEIKISTLPIELAEFDAELYEERSVLIKWKTLSEINNDFFTIEKSIDGKKIAIVETIDGAGNSVKPIDYEFIDQHPCKGITYYRLKQTDFDGKFTYSEWKAVEIDKESQFEMTLCVCPNPNNSNVPINFRISGVEENKKVEIQIVDMNGVVHKNKEIWSDGLETTGQLLATGELGQGVYFVHIISDDQKTTEKLIITN